MLKTVTKADIQAAKAEVDVVYATRIDGFDTDYLAEMDEFGNLPRTYVLGAQVEFVAEYGADSLIDLVLQKLAEGYTRSATPTYCAGNNGVVYNLYMVKPQAQQDEDLKKLYAKAEAKLQASVEKYNESVIEHEVQLQIASAARKRTEELAAAAKAQEERIRKEVEEALRVTRKAVRMDLGAV